MEELSREDRRRVEAAEGWIELGMPAEARQELEPLAWEHRTHPAVLEVRWQIAAREKQWETCLELASALIQAVPELPLGWIHRSYSLHELKQTAEARDNLLRVVDNFPGEAIVRYNLACYECQLGRSEQARQWLQKAFSLGHAGKMKAMALDDLDLKPLWKEIADGLNPGVG
jgi:predicted Zn-dependent protease